MLKLVRTIDMPAIYIYDYCNTYPKTYFTLKEEILNDRNAYIKKVIENETIKDNNSLALSEYFLIDDSNPEHIIGLCQINEYDPSYIDIGDIAYEITPSERRKGYGNKILELVLQEWQRLGKRRIVYVSCKPDNEASKRVIIANGGIFDKKFYDDWEGEGIRYKIKLKSSLQTVIKRLTRGIKKC